MAVRTTLHPLAPTVPDDIVARIHEQLQRELAWTVFEPNAEPVWQRVRMEAEDLLTGHWRAGELLGATPEEAFFVRCDSTTMTQNDLDNGRLVALVGLAVLAPAEFLLLRIEQTVGDRRAGRLPAPRRS